MGSQLTSVLYRAWGQRPGAHTHTPRLQVPLQPVAGPAEAKPATSTPVATAWGANTCRV